MKKCEVCELNRSHLIDWYGEDGKLATVKGLAVFLDGELSAIGGLRYLQGKWFAFTDIKDDLRTRRVFIHRTTTRYLNSQLASHRVIYTVQDQHEKTAARWLAALGFVPFNGDIWRWRR